MLDTDFPLLVFPEPVPAERAKRAGGGGKPRVPDPSAQANRLAPQFQRLQEAMENRRIALQESPLGLVPEQVLVLETVGEIGNFIKAVQRVEGFEWLGEQELEDILPEHGFEHERGWERRLTGRLYLVMSNQQALKELQKLFEIWRGDPDVRFRRGLAPLKQAFQNLYTIRPWGIEDRVSETGILQDWQERLSHEADESGFLPFEAELWFRKSVDRRTQAEAELRRIVDSRGGEVVQHCVIPEIEYHALLGNLPRTQVQAIVEDPEAFQKIDLLKCEEIMFARPVGQCAVGVQNSAETQQLTDEDLSQFSSRQPSPDQEPTLALFDGLPLVGHRLLDGFLMIDDPDGFDLDYQAQERVHGTAMASLICHGDINKPQDAPQRLVYARPILKPRRQAFGTVYEAVPENMLPVDLIHRAVRHLFEAEDGNPPAAPSIRVINLSVADPARPFTRDMSAWARVLDWLAWKYRILFVVSAGNQAQNIELAVSRSQLRSLAPEALEREVIRSLDSDARNRRILSPAETLNGLTIGAAHEDASSVRPVGTYPPFSPYCERRGMPTVTSARGPGYRRAIKPDLLFPGGRHFVTDKLGNSRQYADLEVHRLPSPPGLRVAAPGPVGQLNRTAYTRGTSCSAATASRGAVQVLDLLDQVRGMTGGGIPLDYHVVLTKALLAHGAEWSNAEHPYRDVLTCIHGSRRIRERLGSHFGYGTADLAKATTCTEQRVTVLGFGELEDGQGAEFSFPLPPCLSAVRERRQLTITLAWISPVNSANQKYRVAHLWFDPKNDFATDRQFADYQAAQRGTLQHEVLEGIQALDYQTGEAIQIKINCRADAGIIDDPIPYGLAVTLEVAEDMNVPIYQEVRDQLSVRVPAQV